MKRNMIVCDKCQKEFEEEKSVYASLYITENGRVSSCCDICDDCLKKIFDCTTTPTEKEGEQK